MNDTERAEKIERLAALILAGQQERLRRDYPTSDQWEWETVNVKLRQLYTLIDVGPRHNRSGKYMIEHATGIIYGIKAYGKVHKGHQYGTLDTIDAWDWSGYTARPKAVSA